MSKPLVLITGATGHIGFRTLVIALQQGYRARIALRKLEQVDKIKHTASIEPYLNSIEFIQVPDITVSNAYDEAIKGVEFVIHVASPIYGRFDPDDHDWKKLLYDPAERGTTRILEAAEKESSVKRVVITSSVAAIEAKNGKESAGPYDLASLPNEETLMRVATAPEAYRFSKVLSHIAGDKFMAQRRPSFELIRVLPGYVQGANELYTSAEQMRDEGVVGSNEGVMFTALGKSVGHGRITMQVFLDDVAKAHVFALKESVAKNGTNLLIVGNGGKSVDWSDYVPVIEKYFPEALAMGHLSPKAEDASIGAAFDVASSEKALGFRFAGPEEQVKGLVGQYLGLLAQEKK